MKSLSTMLCLLLVGLVPFSVSADEGASHGDVNAKAEHGKEDTVPEHGKDAGKAEHGQEEKGKLHTYKEGRDDIVGVDDENGEMEAAMEKARKTLPTFVKEIQNRDDENKRYLLKVEISEGEHTEYVWLIPVKWMDPGLAGILASEPGNIKKVKKGDVIYPLPKEISDWMIMHRDGTKQGGYTVDVIEKLEKAEKEKKAAQLKEAQKKARAALEKSMKQLNQQKK